MAKGVRVLSEEIHLWEIFSDFSCKIVTYADPGENIDIENFCTRNAMGIYIEIERFEEVLYYMKNSTIHVNVNNSINRTPVSIINHLAVFSKSSLGLKIKAYGSMVACDDPVCRYEWFHYGCVNVIEKPKGKWFCPECAPKHSTSEMSGIGKT
ncbi:unnamed protein product [Onchocerca flexuosa]|uniref:PHD domain-containing protein n=1 Tax=Onchocerca flexuosa TaxID=387005 RepID=A0A183I0E6_9BILA|nr:unnamed protein product [Onchocerca flexuosa]